MSVNPVITEQIYPVPVEKVWQAITDRDAMKQWYFDLKEFRPEVGFEFRFWGGPAEDRQYLHICEITEVIPNKKLSYSWRYDGYEGQTLVSIELLSEGTQTRLKLSHSGLETFPSDNTDFAPENFIEGWNWIIGKSLKEFLEQK
jgi:uncharacterized protein YndB with AHSA1/START domain